MTQSPNPIHQPEASEPHPKCPNAFICAGRCSGDRCADAMQPATPIPPESASVSSAGAVPEGYRLIASTAYGQQYVSLVAPDGKIIVNAYEQGAPQMFAFLSALNAQPPATPQPSAPAETGEVAELTTSTYGVGLIKFCAPETALRYLAKRLREAGIDSSVADDYAQSIDFLLARRDDLAPLEPIASLAQPQVAASPKCRMCNGHGLVGYPTGHPNACNEECPDCKGTGLAASPALEPEAGDTAVQTAGDVVMWQSRFFDTSNGPAWREWEEVVPRNAYTDTVETKVQELRDYIAAGYKYELRALCVAAPYPRVASGEVAALQQAREALFYHQEQTRPIDKTANAIKAVDAALAASPPAPTVAERVPLTGARIAAINREAQDQAIIGLPPAIHLARAIEAAHGIGAKKTEAADPYLQTR